MNHAHQSNRRPWYDILASEWVPGLIKQEHCETHQVVVSIYKWRFFLGTYCLVEECPSWGRASCYYKQFMNFWLCIGYGFGRSSLRYSMGTKPLGAIIQLVVLLTEVGKRSPSFRSHPILQQKHNRTSFTEIYSLKISFCMDSPKHLQEVLIERIILQPQRSYMFLLVNETT